MNRFQMFMVDVAKSYRSFPEWRYGQTLFNVLYSFDRDLAEEIRGDETFDPFYMKDNELEVFLNWVEKRLNE